MALVVGLCAGALLVWVVLRRAAPDPAAGFEPAEPVVPAGVAEVLAVLNSTGVVVGSAGPGAAGHGRRPDRWAWSAAAGSSSRGCSTWSGPYAGSAAWSTTELQVTTRAGAPVSYLSVRVAPLDEDLILVLADDQTGARRIEQIRRDFVANVSHELKTPIGAISLLAEAVEEAADDPVAVRRFASRMGVESARLTDLVAQIIDLSRLQGDNPLADPEVVDVDDVLSEAVDRRRVDAEQRQVTLTIAGASRQPGAGQRPPARGRGRQPGGERGGLLRSRRPGRGRRRAGAHRRGRRRRDQGVRQRHRHPAG